LELVARYALLTTYRQQRAMSLHIIIDGYNLIRRSKGLGRLDRQDIARGREALVGQLAAYRRIKPHRITVVFDGLRAPDLSPPRDRVLGITIVFSRGGESADAVITRMARQEGDRSMVVTSDLAVARAAEACGAAVVDSSEFEARMAMAAALEGSAEPAEEPPGRRVSTRKKGEGRRLPKRLRRQRLKAGKL
jgi:predicted RNA-binding protein with PIN domain